MLASCLRAGPERTAAALARLDLTLDQRQLELTYRYGPAPYGHDHHTYTEVTRGFDGVGLRPLAPTRLKGRRDHVSGDWLLTWLRRTRIGGDSWAGPDVPLGEESERYRLEILAAPGDAVLRTAELAVPAFTYTAEMQIADFAATVPNVPIRVAQLSPAYGLGSASEYLTHHYEEAAQ